MPAFSATRIRWATESQTKRRPKSKPAENAPLDDFRKSACPSWNSPQTLSLSSFLPPAAGVQLADLQCPFCSLVVDKPVQAARGRVVCCNCVTEYMEQNGSESSIYPCCSGTHTTLPIPAAAVVVQLVGSLQLCCGACKTPIELREIREHVNSGCTVGSLPSSSQ